MATTTLAYATGASNTHVKVELLSDQFVDMKFMTALTTLSDKWLNHPGDRGGCLVKVKQVPQRVLQVVDSIFLQLQPVGCRQSIPADVGD